MRLKILFDENLKILKIPVVIKTPHNRIKSNFVLDTGSPHTILNYSDSRRLNVPQSEKAELIRLGGKAYQGYKFNKIELLFKSEDNQLVIESISVRALKLNSSKIEEAEQLDRCPNLLGIDFLEKGYKLFCDLITKEVYFEKS